MIYRKILARVGGIGGHLAQTDHAPGLVVSKTTPVTGTELTAAAHRMFTVTGTVKITSAFAIIDTALVGAGATVELGVASNTAVLIAQTTAPETLNVAKDVWVGRGTASGTPKSGEVDGGGVILIDIDIDLKVGTASITAGAMTVYIEYTAMSADGKIATAVWD